MEEQALYRAILAAPHDDMPRLIYADWLDENADAFPTAQARAERARAEFIRLQCKITRLNSEGWTQAMPRGWSQMELAKRQHRLLFHHGKKWRRAFPVGFASAPFDRGFLRPFISMRPQEFLGRLTPPQVPRPPLPPLPPDSTAARYVPDEPFAACPLWDLHLFASSWHDDPLADRGQYGEWLVAVGQSPQMERIGWLKLSFFETPTAEFLRAGNFANVETLVLNCGPFPEVLEAISENESFRSLRYVQFGSDRWSWAASFPMVLRFFTLSAKIREANYRNLPHGEMRPVLRSILHNTPLVPVAPPPTPLVMPPFAFPSGTGGGASTDQSVGKVLGGLGVMLAILMVILNAGRTSSPTPPPVPSFKMPDLQLLKSDPKQFEFPKHDPELEKLLKRLEEENKSPNKDHFKEWLEKTYREGKWKTPLPRTPVAPAPRPVERKD